ncbi:MAG: hypothetical protein IT161_24105 [Bryobacterales bacterium]|nr:hypothetical protein [Bryobacterales bacterium]
MTLKKNVLGERGTLAFVVLFLVFTSGAPLLAYEPPDGAQEAAGSVDPQAGTFLYRGGQAIGKMARTTTTATVFGETAGWITLPGSLSWTVPGGTTQLFNVAYSAECRLFNGGGDDYVRIRIVDITGGVATPLEPYDGGQAFCSADGYATHKGNWVKRAGPGIHTLIVQIWIFDGAPAEVLSVRIDDTTFELVVYT